MTSPDGHLEVKDCCHAKFGLTGYKSQLVKLGNFPHGVI